MNSYQEDKFTFFIDDLITAIRKEDEDEEIKKIKHEDSLNLLKGEFQIRKYSIS